MSEPGDATREHSEADTAEYPVLPTNPHVLPPVPVSSRTRVDLAALSHQGNVRPNNEDHYLVVRFDRNLHTLLTNLAEGHVPHNFAEVGYGMLVADGMGGMAAGELASQVAVTTLVNLMLNMPDWIMRTGQPHAEEIVRRLGDLFRQVDLVLREHVRADPSLSGMGTTMSLVCSIGPELFLGHVGDSRVYLLRRGELSQLTRDHTLVCDLAESGAIDPSEAPGHPMRHVLTRFIGGGAGKMDAQLQRLLLEDDDQVLLCSDGLTDRVDDETIGGVLRGASSAQQACDCLVEQALRNGGRDNVTVVLGRYNFPHGAA
jgi:protein phosphatase